MEEQEESFQKISRRSAVRKHGKATPKPATTQKSAIAPYNPYQSPDERHEARVKKASDASDIMRQWAECRGFSFVVLVPGECFKIQKPAGHYVTWRPRFARVTFNSTRIARQRAFDYRQFLMIVGRVWRV